jgi:hypothetical protein
MPFKSDEDKRQYHKEYMRRRREGTGINFDIKPAEFDPTLKHLLGMLLSDNDNERNVAALKIKQRMNKLGITWDDVTMRKK